MPFMDKQDFIKGIKALIKEIEETPGLGEHLSWILNEQNEGIKWNIFVDRFGDI